MEIALVLVLLLVAIGLFASEKLSVDVITLILLIVLTCTKIITPEEAYAGFSSDFIVILASIFVLSAALEDTGVLDFLVNWLMRHTGHRPTMLLLFIMIVPGLISAFMNNTTVTALFVTPIVGVAKKMQTSSSKYLMPLAYASILGGTCTLIGTSTNVAVSGYMAKAGFEPFGFFEFSGIGIIVFAVGIVYMMTIGNKMLPAGTTQGLTTRYNIKTYLTEILVQDESPLIGQIAFASDLSKMGFRILNIIRSKENFLPDYRTRIRANDVLLVEGEMDDLIKVKETKGIQILADVIVEDDLVGGDIRLAEILITGKSDLLKRSIREIEFLRRFGLVVLAVSRQGETIRTKIGDVQLQLGDLLLVQGSAERLEYLKMNQHLAVLDEFKPVLFKERKGILTLAFFILAIIIGSTGVLPLSTSFLGAAVMSILFKCISTDRAYQVIDWRLLILIGGMTAFGMAMANSGADKFLAHWIVQLLEPFGVLTILAGFILLTVFLTQPMSNAAAALVVLPVALQTAAQIDANPRTFAIAIMLSASVSLITPFEPSCILVYGPGKYSFRDFLKIGSGLTLLLIILILFLVPVFWPLTMNN
ncbi:MULTISPECIES: SLC13 family permease [Rufibacter]|uniref:Di/tricarboxylate transporter n=1 Tax=Rufibacter quisquiliarum TaxID=1549639 RepID=A0A839GZ82_9BACT|nr:MULTISPECIES: SLC13 family permease [Rufibacter]MBA9079748.1 di/tricarboxylate transporter [Rufibacter quisquiliarum]